MLLFTTVKLPFTAYCDNSVIGSKFPIILDGINGELHFPRHSHSTVYEEKKFFPIDNLIAPVECLMSMNNSITLDWGKCLSYDGLCSVDRLYISIETDDANIKELGDRLSAITTDFIERLFLYIQILGEFSIDKVSSSGFIDTSKPVFCYLDCQSKVKTASKTIASGSILITNIISPINDSLVKESLHYVSTGKKPHLAHSILRDANYHFNKCDYRRAILDATTSVEIAVTNKISSILELTHNHNDQSIKFILKNYNGLKKKSDFLFTIHPELNNITNKKEFDLLCDKRNKSIHEGISATSVDADKIIEISQRVVHHLCNLTE